MKKTCIQVEQRLGEQLRLILVEHGHLDTDYPITKDRTYLYLPLRRKLSSSELAKFAKEIPKFTQVEKDLKPVLKKPADLSAALQEILPEDLHQFLPHSLDIIGEIAIVELHNEVVSYEEEIGKAIMVVNSRVSTVYAKEGGVEGVCRVRPLRLIAGKGCPLWPREDERSDTYHYLMSKQYSQPLPRTNKLRYDHHVYWICQMQVVLLLPVT